MLKNFKKHWEITSNWQLTIPLMGIIGLFYSSYKLVRIFAIESLAINIALSLVL